MLGKENIIDDQSFVCPRCQTRLLLSEVDNSCKVCGTNLRKELWKLSDKKNLLTPFGYRLAGVSLGFWTGVLVWIVTKAKSPFDRSQDIGLIRYATVAGLIGLLLLTVVSGLIAPKKRRKMERILFGYTIGLLTSLVFAIIVSRSPETIALVFLISSIATYHLSYKRSQQND